MSTPVGHALFGVTAGSAASRPSDLAKCAVIGGMVAIAPDLDFLPGLLVGDPDRFHHGVTHTLAAAVVAASIAWFAAPARRRWRWSTVVGAAYVSHLLLDMVTLDPSAPHGIPLFWPLDHGWVYGPVLLPRVIHSAASPLNLHNLLVVLLELFAFGALSATVVFGRISHARRKSRTPADRDDDAPDPDGGDERVRDSASGGVASRPLRIGIMLRGVGEVDGPGVYIRALCNALFELDDRNEYVAFYDDASEVGRFADFPHVEEKHVWAPAKILWDQMAVPVASWTENIDVLFHHKFTIPLVSPCPTVVQQRGVEYWTYPQWYDTLDRLHATTAIPLYCRRATRVLTNSETLADDLMPYIDVPREEVEVVYAAPDERFRPVTDETVLTEVREAYRLPERPFYLMVAKGYPSVHSDQEESYPRKNVQGVVAAYRRVRERTDDPPPLVVAGPGFDRQTRARHEATLSDASSLNFPGYVDSGDMPALYSLAHSLVFPSYSESFGLPLVEAMACGCPVVAARTGACPEVVDDAGILVDPHDPDDIADAMSELAGDPSLHEELTRRGRERASDFSWQSSAEKLSRILRSAARQVE